MRKWTKSAGLLFLAASAVYAGGAAGAGQDIAAKAPDAPAKADDVKPLPDDAAAGAATAAADPFATTRPAADAIVPVAAPEKNVPPPKLVASDAGTFSIQINNDTNLVELLRMVGNQGQVSIIPSKDVKGTVPAMDLYNVTVTEALDAILKSGGYVGKKKGNFIFVYTAKEAAELERATRVASTEVFHLYYSPAANVVAMIKPVLSADAQVSFTTPAQNGLATGVTDTGGDSHATEDMIVVTDYAENLDRVRKVIKEVDRRPQQVLVEATILQASLTENNAFGVDLSVLGGVNFGTLVDGVTGGSSGGSSGGTSGGTSGGGSSGGSSGGGSSSSGFNDALTGNILNNQGSGAILNQGYAGGRVGGNGLQVGVVTDNVALFINALEGVTDTTVLANPKVLALDKQKGEVIVGRKDGYITTTVSQTTSTQTVEFLETGTRLVFRPYVGDDGYIRMEIHPEDSSGGLTASNLPFKVTTEVTSNIMVKDGHTIVIGGLFREASSTSRSQVPILGNLPLAGPLFRKTADATSRQEIIILLTPHVVKNDAAYSEASEQELKDAEKLRVGVRQGMMPWGRERLAESSYEQAVAEMNKPHPDLKKALWHLDCAINLNPKFLEAINLKEKITGQEVTSVDNSSIRSFVQRQIMADPPTPSTRPSSVRFETTPAAVGGPNTPADDRPPKPTAAAHDAPAATERKSWLAALLGGGAAQRNSTTQPRSQVDPVPDATAKAPTATSNGKAQVIDLGAPAEATTQPVAATTAPAPVAPVAVIDPAFVAPVASTTQPMAATQPAVATTQPVSPAVIVPPVVEVIPAAPIPAAPATTQPSAKPGDVVELPPLPATTQPVTAVPIEPVR